MAVTIAAINKKLAKTRTKRVRLALFPDSLDPEEAADIPRLATGPSGRPSAIDILTEPARELRQAIEDIINYQAEVREWEFRPKIHSPLV